MPHKFVMEPEMETSVSTTFKEQRFNYAINPDPERIINNNAKIEVRGKFFFHGDEKFHVKGVTYGAFEPDSKGQEYFNIDKIDADFAMMARSGFNTVRIPHTTPPRYLLDIAEKHNLKVMIGLSAEQYVGYLIDKKKANDIYGDIRKKVRSCANHPALLCIAIGNEITASMVRLIGRKKIEKYLKKVYDTIKEEAPDSIVTYVNYPTTEYLQLPFLDLLCFNVYLESPEKLENYLARLQNIAGNRPLMLGEVGLDSIRNGTEKQSEVLNWQIKMAFTLGCAGLFIFSWTDEWYRGGEEVHDWAFGLTDKQRLPKPALDTVIQAFRNIPEKTNKDWPLISVVVCSHNGSKTISECLDMLLKINYSNYEVIVVNDGSTDNTRAIAEQYPFRLISTENHGLSHARNIGGNAAKGEIIAYIDDDAIPDVDWLAYLATTFMMSVDIATCKAALFSFPRNLGCDTRYPTWFHIPLENGQDFGDCMNALWRAAASDPVHFQTPDGELNPGPDCQSHFDCLRGWRALTFAIQNFANEQIDGVLSVNLKGFVALINALPNSGVWIDVPKPGLQDLPTPCPTQTDPNHKCGYYNSQEQLYPVDFPAGCQFLKGEDALAFARSRHQDDDYERGRRQQIFLQQVRKQLDPMSLFANMANLISAAQANLFMTFEQSDLQYLAQIASHVDADRLYRYDFAPPRLTAVGSMDGMAAKIANIFQEPEPVPDNNNQDPCPPKN